MRRLLERCVGPGLILVIAAFCGLVLAVAWTA